MPASALTAAGASEGVEAVDKARIVGIRAEATRLTLRRGSEQMAFMGRTRPKAARAFIVV